MTGRFAPSPTGRMHLGNIWAALMNWLYIRAGGGRVLLRIEDIDRSRCRPEYGDMLLRDMEALGLDWDGPIMCQSERMDIYREILAGWANQTYPCYCTRADLHSASAPHAREGVYSGRCRSLPPQDKPHALRLMLPDEDDAYDDIIHRRQSANLRRDIGDIVIWRKDDAPSYQFACGVDDALMGVDMVIRGRDLLPSAFPQRHIARRLGKTPARYLHIPLLVDARGHRLSKRQASLDLGRMLEAGLSVPDILGELGYTAGLLDAPCPATAAELLAIIKKEGFPALPATDIIIDGGQD